MLGHNWTVHFARVGENNFAIHKFRKHELMNCRRGGVNPSKSLRSRDLFWADRPGYNHLGIGDFSVYRFVIGKIDNLNLRKFHLQSIWKPGWCIPLIEGVGNKNEEVQ